jgi:hypothetical protein
LISHGNHNSYHSKHKQRNIKNKMRKDIILSLVFLLGNARETNSFSPFLQKTGKRTAKTSILGTITQVASQESTVGCSRSRRDVLQTASACLVLFITRPNEVMAATSPAQPQQEDNNNMAFQFQITTTLPNGFSASALGPESALEITVKPAVTYTDQVPKQVAEESLSKTGHWCPIVLRSRQRCSDLRLTDGDTGVTTILTMNHITSEAGTNIGWWDKLPLIVTAKLDSDGLDTTFAPTDLVGCRILANLGGITKQHVTIPLQRRGLCSELLASYQDKDSQATYLPIL